ncbi:hypothetical protein [Pseudarthrobacter sp. PvP090]|uniref:hypothetical protein n=1 Tax=Pseudarthrobacter sp. PvP090 TaxID=3156393 RepID=UPI00339AAE39
MEHEAVDFHDQESFDQEVDPADPGQIDLSVVANPVSAEQVLGVDLHDGLGAQVQLLQRLADQAGPVGRELGLQ